MIRLKYLSFIVFLFLANSTFAQKNERDYLRSGNKLYNDSLFVKAEVDYRKALDINPKSTEAMYNLGNTLTQQQKFKEAMEQYDAASRIEKNKDKLSRIYHNMGVILQADKQYPQCIEAYKQALRNNPKDNETRYNLALAQKLLKDQQQQQNQNNKDNKDQEKKDQQKKDQEQQKDQKKEDQQQQPKPEKQNENQMSKENAEQLLNSVTQDEKEVQDKVKKQMQQVQSGKLDKDW